MITLRTILRGAATRFLPALLLVMALIYWLAPRVSLTGMGLYYGLVASGYLVTLVALRYRLRADAGIDGRRSILAGLLVPFAHLAGLVVLPTATLGVPATSCLIGAALALGMYFPWLKPAPVAALTDGEAESLLEEGQPEFIDLGRTREAAYAGRGEDNQADTTARPAV